MDREHNAILSPRRLAAAQLSIHLMSGAASMRGRQGRNRYVPHAFFLVLLETTTLLGRECKMLRAPLDFIADHAATPFLLPYLLVADYCFDEHQKRPCVERAEFAGSDDSMAGMPSAILIRPVFFALNPCRLTAVGVKQRTHQYQQAGVGILHRRRIRRVLSARSVFVCP